MKHYIVSLFAGFVGTDAHDLLSLPDDHTEEELNEAVWEMALQHAEMFGNYPEEHRPDDFDWEEDEDVYTDNIEGHAEPYDPELHDRYRAGGGSFQDEIDRVEALSDLISRDSDFY